MSTGNEAQQPELRDEPGEKQDRQNQETGGVSESTAKQHTNKLENPENIPLAGGKQLGEDHKGESKMLSENARSESTATGPDGDDLQKRLEGKKVEHKGEGEGEEKKGMVEKAKEKLGLNKDKE